MGKAMRRFWVHGTEGRELRTLANPDGTTDDVRACPMEIMMISSICQIAPYGMLKLFMGWPFCVVLIKPWRWPPIFKLLI